MATNHSDDNNMSGEVLSTTAGTTPDSMEETGVSASLAAAAVDHDCCFKAPPITSNHNRGAATAAPPPPGAEEFSITMATTAPSSSMDSIESTPSASTTPEQQRQTPPVEHFKKSLHDHDNGDHGMILQQEKESLSNEQETNNKKASTVSPTRTTSATTTAAAAAAATTVPSRRGQHRPGRKMELLAKARAARKAAATHVTVSSASAASAAGAKNKELSNGGGGGGGGGGGLHDVSRTVSEDPGRTDEADRNGDESVSRYQHSAHEQGPLALASMVTSLNVASTAFISETARVTEVSNSKPAAVQETKPSQLKQQLARVHSGRGSVPSTSIRSQPDAGASRNEKPAPSTRTTVKPRRVTFPVYTTPSLSSRPSDDKSLKRAPSIRSLPPSLAVHRTVPLLPSSPPIQPCFVSVAVVPTNKKNNNNSTNSDALPNAPLDGSTDGSVVDNSDNNDLSEHDDNHEESSMSEMRKENNDSSSRAKTMTQSQSARLLPSNDNEGKTETRAILSPPQSSSAAASSSPVETTTNGSTPTASHELETNVTEMVASENCTSKGCDVGAAATLTDTADSNETAAAAAAAASPTADTQEHEQESSKSTQSSRSNALAWAALVRLALEKSPQPPSCSDPLLSDVKSSAVHADRGSSQERPATPPLEGDCTSAISQALTKYKSTKIRKMLQQEDQASIQSLKEQYSNHDENPTEEPEESYGNSETQTAVASNVATPALVFKSPGEKEKGEADADSVAVAVADCPCDDNDDEAPTDTVSTEVNTPPALLATIDLAPTDKAENDAPDISTRQVEAIKNTTSNAADDDKQPTKKEVSTCEALMEGTRMKATGKPKEVSTASAAHEMGGDISGGPLDRKKSTNASPSSESTAATFMTLTPSSSSSSLSTSPLALSSSSSVASVSDKNDDKWGFNDAAANENKTWPMEKEGNKKNMHQITKQEEREEHPTEEGESLEPTRPKGSKVTEETEKKKDVSGSTQVILAAPTEEATTAAIIKAAQESEANNRASETGAPDNSSENTSQSFIPATSLPSLSPTPPSESNAAVPVKEDRSSDIDSKTPATVDPTTEKTGSSTAESPDLSQKAGDGAGLLATPSLDITTGGVDNKSQSLAVGQQQQQHDTVESSQREVAVQQQHAEIGNSTDSSVVQGAQQEGVVKSSPDKQLSEDSLQPTHRLEPKENIGGTATIEPVTSLSLVSDHVSVPNNGCATKVDLSDQDARPLAQETDATKIHTESLSKKEDSTIVPNKIEDVGIVPSIVKEEVASAIKTKQQIEEASRCEPAPSGVKEEVTTVEKDEQHGDQVSVKTKPNTDQASNITPGPSVVKEEVAVALKTEPDTDQVLSAPSVVKKAKEVVSTAVKADKHIKEISTVTPAAASSVLKGQVITAVKSEQHPEQASTNRPVSSTVTADLAKAVKAEQHTEHAPSKSEATKSDEIHKQQASNSQVPLKSTKTKNTGAEIATTTQTINHGRSKPDQKESTSPTTATAAKSSPEQKQNTTTKEPAVRAAPPKSKSAQAVPCAQNQNTTTKELAVRAAPSKSKSAQAAPCAFKSMRELIRKDLWSKDPAVTEFALQLITIEAFADPAARAHIGQLGGLLGIVGAMERYAESSYRVQIAGCQALERLALDTENERALAHLGGVEAILACFWRYPDNVAVQEAAWAAMGSLRSNCIETDTAIEAVGGFPALLASMKRHGNNTTVQANACRALGSLCQGNETRLKALIAADGMVTVAHVLQKHWDDPDTRSEASKAMTALCMPK